MFTSILVPFDGSPSATAALRYALDLSRLADGARVTLLTVYRHHSMLEASLSMVRPNDPGNMDDAMRGHAREVVEFGKNIALETGFDRIQAFVKSGPAARTIVKFSEDRGMDLIVMGRRGMGSMEGYMLGSVSHKVTGLSRMPVLLV